MDKLWDIASKEASLANQLSIANIQTPAADKGSWLDTIADIVKLGGSISDVWQSTKD